MQEVDKSRNILDNADSVINLFFQLDEAIDDMENGRVLTIEEVWKEIDAI